MKFIRLACAVARQCENSVWFLCVRARARNNFSPTLPWYYTAAGTESQEKAYAGLCVDLIRLRHTRDDFSFIAKI